MAHVVVGRAAIFVPRKGPGVIATGRPQRRGRAAPRAGGPRSPPRRPSGRSRGRCGPGGRRAGGRGSLPRRPGGTTSPATPPRPRPAGRPRGGSGRSSRRPAQVRGEAVAPRRRGRRRRCWRRRRPGPPRPPAPPRCPGPSRWGRDVSSPLRRRSGELRGPGAQRPSTRSATMAFCPRAPVVARHEVAPRGPPRPSRAPGCPRPRRRPGAAGPDQVPLGVDVDPPSPTSSLRAEKSSRKRRTIHGGCAPA